MSRWPRVWAFVAIVSLGLVGCPPEPDDTSDVDDTSDTGIGLEATPAVTISADTVFLLVGDSLTLTASTTNAEDASYAWTSSDELVATVASTGEVTGVGMGEVTITATGADSAAAGTIDLYVSETIPHLDDWAGSGHSDYDAEAFTHWSTEDDGFEVEAACARCHSATGYRDFVANLGDTSWEPEPVPAGEVIECMACHDPTSFAVSRVIFPSGATVTDLGHEAICMQCHQGRASTDSVNAEIADPAGDGSVAEPGIDEVEPELGFQNIHYYAAGATLYAGVARGGYQYDSVDGEEPLYDVRFRHVSGLDTCVGCHSPHTLERRLERCADCHTAVTTDDDVKDIRMMASLTTDYDGDGNLTEGMHYELAGLQEKLLAALVAYANDDEARDPICYSGSAYPYFFQDVGTATAGECAAADATFGNRYLTWTPRSLRAGYNYQVSKKDPGTHAHNAKYIAELLHDSITDLNDGLSSPIAFTGTRNDPGHFDGASEPFRHWDEDEEVDAACSKCHGGADGFHFYTTFGVNIEHLEVPNGLECETCHNRGFFEGDESQKFWTVESVLFPSGVTLDAEDFSSTTDAICATCHSGREAGATVDAYIAATDPARYTFRNIHYLAAAATWFGARTAPGAHIQGDGDYSVDWAHSLDSSTHSATRETCQFCHDGSLDGSKHTFQPADVLENTTTCSLCHSGATTPDDLRLGDIGSFDFDGDGDTDEPLADELAEFQKQLLLALREYTSHEGLAEICYDGSRYPYWFVETGTAAADGTCGTAGDRYGYSRTAPACYDADDECRWDALMLRTAHNFQLSSKDPGAWAHNMPYVTQLLYDSIEALDDISGGSNLDPDGDVNLQRTSLFIPL